MARHSGKRPAAGFEDSPGGIDDRWTVLVICLSLAAITWVVFGQTLRHQFINFDDVDFVSCIRLAPSSVRQYLELILPDS